MKKYNLKSLAKATATDIIGGIFIAVGVYNFAAAAKFPMVGFNGIGLIFYQLFGLPIGTTVLIMNIPVMIFCYKILGKRFFANSIRTMVITSLLIDYVAPLFPTYEGDRLLAAICCGVFSGIGYAIIYMNDTSTGGADFITMSIRAKNPHLSLGSISFAMDASVVLLGTALVSKDVDSLIFGFILTYIMTVIIDKVMYGIDEGKLALIVTDHGPEICKQIDDVLGRGSTILKGMGSYSREEKDVVMCACNNKQMYGIRRLVKQIDRKAFLVIMESNEVVGEGFKSE